MDWCRRATFTPFALLHSAVHHMIPFLGLGYLVSDTRSARAAMQNKGNPPCGRTPTVLATLACGLGHTVSDPRSRTHGLGHTVSDTRSRTHGLGHTVSDTWPSGQLTRDRKLTRTDRMAGEATPGGWAQGPHVDSQSRSPHQLCPVRDEDRSTQVG